MQDNTKFMLENGKFLDTATIFPICGEICWKFASLFRAEKEFSPIISSLLIFAFNVKWWEQYKYCKKKRNIYVNWTTGFTATQPKEQYRNVS
jgi:hypothetical protein